MCIYMQQACSRLVLKRMGRCSCFAVGMLDHTEVPIGSFGFACLLLILGDSLFEV